MTERLTSSRPWRRPDREKTDPTSEYYVPNDPEVRSRQRSPQPNPRIPRRVRLEIMDSAPQSDQEAAWRSRVSQGATEDAEPTECPRCGYTPIQALTLRQPPAVIIAPGKVMCSCSPEVIDVRELYAQRRGEESAERRMIRECWEEQMRRPHEPGSESTGRSKATRGRPDKDRPEQEWHGFAQEDQTEVTRLEKLVVVLKGKVPRVLAKRLKTEAAKLGKHRESHLFRWLIAQHLVALEEAFEVEYGSDTVMLEVMVTRQHADLWAAVKAGLSTDRRVSNADLMASVMLREWA